MTESEKSARKMFEQYCKEGTRPLMYDLTQLAGGEYASCFTEWAWKIYWKGINAQPADKKRPTSEAEENTMTTKLATHTPGPWTIETTEGMSTPHPYESGPSDAAVMHKGAGVAVMCAYLKSVGEQEANARLIAAAPDMLAALELVRMSLGWQYLSAESKLVIDNAIRAAVGDQEENTRQ